MFIHSLLLVQLLKYVLGEYFNMLKFKQKTAFTLAEVLITLGIIGVIAAITIPVLISNYRKKQLETQIKATYSTIQQAIQFADYEGVSYSTVKDGSDAAIKEWFDSLLGKHLKVEQLCINRNPTGCWHQVKTLAGANYGDSEGIGTNIIGFTIAKGASVTIDAYNANDMTNTYGINTSESGLVFFFDANGKTKPNVLGKDVYIMAWTAKGLVPAGSSKTKAQIEQNCFNGTGAWCLNEVLSKGFVIPDNVWKRSR